MTQDEARDPPQDKQSEKRQDWISFWDTPHSVYVNARHLDAHYRRIADDIAPYVPSGGTVLDYGCGEALSHNRIAHLAGKLILCEAAPGVRASLQARFGGNEKIVIVSPEQIETMADGTVDLIVMHSVAQYVDGGALYGRLTLFHRLLKRNGHLLMGDIIPPTVSPLKDAHALLHFAWQEGFFMAAVCGLFRTAFSSYARLRSKIGLTRYTEDAMVERLAAAGFDAIRMQNNVGHNPERMTFMAQPRTDATIKPR